MSFPRQRNFPANIIGCAPVDGRISARRDAIGQRSPPLRPAICGSSGNAAPRLIRQGRKRGQTGEKEGQEPRTSHGDSPQFSIWWLQLPPELRTQNVRGFVELTRQVFGLTGARNGVVWRVHLDGIRKSFA